MNKLQGKITVIIVLLIAGIYLGNLGYGGDQASAAHFLTEGHWDEETCGGCHAGEYDEVMSSYHVQRDGDFKDSMYSGLSYLTRFEIESGNEDEWTEMYMNYHPGGGPLETIDGNDGIAVDCNICHDQTGEYNWGARGKAISLGRFAEANVNAMASALENYPVSFGVSTDVSCANTCHTTDVKTRAVAWAEEDYENYDAHANNSVSCVDCHITESHQIGRGDTSDSADNSYDNTMKTCDEPGCHGGITHDMVIDGAHIGIVSCEACHVPVLSADLNDPVVKSANWNNGVVDITYRDSGEFAPILAWFNGSREGELPNVGGKNDTGAQLKPFTTIMVTWWDEGLDANVIADPDSYSVGNPIPLADVSNADADADGNVTLDEIRELYPDAVLRTVDMYFSVSHNIAGGGSGLDEALGCEDCHGYVEDTENVTILDWTSLGYETDPGQTDPPTDFAAVNFTVIPYSRPRPIEIEQEPQLMHDLKNLTGGQ